MNLISDYEQDFHQWIEHHVALLREGRFNEIDVEHLIEELEGMAKRDRHELMSLVLQYCIANYYLGSWVDIAI